MNIANGKGIVVSDLHIGRPDTNGKEVLIELARATLVHKPSLIVLNGDIIEAKEYPGNYEQSVAAIDDAVARIRGLVQVAAQENPDSQVVYVFGNHDCRYEVAERLKKLQQEFPDNFVVEETLLRVRDALFTHGDLMINYDHMPSNGAIVRAGLTHTLEVHSGSVGERGDDPAGHSSWKAVKGFSRGKSLYKRIENRAIGMVDTLCSGIVFPLDQVIPAIHRTLKDEQILDDVNHVFIGHIHPPHNTVREHDGVTFRVTGPATQFSKNTTYLFDINDTEIANVQTLQQVRKAAGGWRNVVQDSADRSVANARG